MGAKENFPVNLSYYLKRARMNQVELANAVGKTEGSVSHWLAGDSFPHINTVQKIADTLGCATDDLITENISRDIAALVDQKQEKEMIGYWGRLNSNNKKAVLDLMKALAESQEETK